MARPNARKKPKLLSVFRSEPESPLRLHTHTHGNIPAMMGEGSQRMSTSEPYLHGEAVTEDHVVAASLPIEHSAIDETGHMDHHRKPIISVHGKDIDEHELDHMSAA